MRRLLLLTPDFPPRHGGVARYLAAFCDFFADRISVIAAPEPGSEAFDRTARYPIARKKLDRPKGLWPWLHAVELLLEARKDYDMAVVSHVLPYGTAARLARFLGGRPYVVIVHGMDLGLAKGRPLKRFVAGHVLRRAELVVANSQSLATELRHDFRVRRIVVAYPPVTVNVAAATKKDDGLFHLLTVARLVPRKGHVRVLEAIASLPAALRSTVRYEIVGEGPERDRIERAIRALGLSETVALRGETSDEALRAAFASADAFVMPVVKDKADREGFGLAYLEAAASGVPAIATDMPGVDEAVLDCETGLLVRDGSVHELSAAIELLMTVPEARAFLSQRARRRALEEFTPLRQFGLLRERL
jgi:phosphatidylinositol alpha-1,6-mannosyltransferase